MSHRITQSKIILVDYFFRPGRGTWILNNNFVGELYLSDPARFAQLFAWKKGGGWKVGVMTNKSWEQVSGEVVRVK